MEGETGGYGTVGRWTDGQIKLEILGGIHAYMAGFLPIFLFVAAHLPIRRRGFGNAASGQIFDELL